MASAYGDYEPVIGLEVHAQLLTKTKLFCGCRTSFGDPPNTHVCPVCLGLPGALPVLNGEAVRLAVRAALALGCTVHAESIFARKNYFYPDLPKGYQISQYDRPFSTAGALELGADRARGAGANDAEIGDAATGDARATTVRARVLRIHMEEDAGKNLHGVGASSVVDLNRAGTPLVEIVGEPDLRGPSEAGEYLRRLREILMFIGVNDGNLEQGSFRCDANVSVRKIGEARLGTRTELKNINSFRFVEEAIDVEIRRQIAELEAGRKLRQQTRGYNSEKRESYLLRDKENDAGYRYFPEPDLQPLVLDAAFVEGVRAAMPELPKERRARYVDVLGLTPYAASVLTSHPEIARFFDDAVRLGADATRAANFIQAEVLRDVELRGLEARLPVSAAQLCELLALVDRGTISGKQAKEVYAKMRGTQLAPGDIVREAGMAVLSDASALTAIAERLVAANPKQASQYRAGKTNLLGFFVGQMMKETKGSADPALVNEILKRLLEASS